MPLRGRRQAPAGDVANPARSLGDFLNSLAPPRPLGSRRATLPRENMMMLDEATGGDGELRRSYQTQRQAWAAIGGMFPGKVMPAPSLLRDDNDLSAYGYYPERRGQTGWIDLNNRVARDLAAHSDHDPERYTTPEQQRSDALTTLLHEWAHTMQPPRVRKEQASSTESPMAEGGAEAFAQILAPMVSRQLGRPFEPLEPAYGNEVHRALSRHGAAWALRGQFKWGPRPRPVRRPPPERHRSNPNFRKQIGG